jgi:hypothetical protein
LLFSKYADEKRFFPIHFWIICSTCAIRESEWEKLKQKFSLVSYDTFSNWHLEYNSLYWSSRSLCLKQNWFFETLGRNKTHRK